MTKFVALSAEFCRPQLSKSSQTRHKPNPTLRVLIFESITKKRTIPGRCGCDTPEGGCSVADADGDGVQDSADNCPNDPSAGQSDADGDGNGILDDQEVEALLDIDGDGTPDRDQANIKCVQIQGAKGQIGISIVNSSAVIAIDALESMDVAEALFAIEASNPRSAQFGCRPPHRYRISGHSHRQPDRCSDQ